MLLVVIFYALFALALWKIFEKMGTDGWRGIIPIYNIYVLFDMLWDAGGFLRYVISLIAGVILAVAGIVLTGGSVLAVFLGGGGAVLLITAAILILAGIIFFIYACIVWIRLLHRLSRASGHGGLFTSGLVFFPYIMLLVLAFGPSRFYVENGSGEYYHDGPGPGGNPYRG